VATCIALAVAACTPDPPAAWNGPTLESPRTQLRVEDLYSADHSPLLDMSFFARPAWAGEARHTFSGSLALARSPMLMPLSRAHHPGEDVFPAVTLDFFSHRGALIPRQRALIATHDNGAEGWDLFVGSGAVWSEPTDSGYSRASFPLSLTDRFVGAVRNCVGSFVYTESSTSRVHLQCSQETADLADAQIGDARASVAARYTPRPFEEAARWIEAEARIQSGRIPVRALGELDRDGTLARHFDRALHTRAPTSIAAVYLDGYLYVHPARTRHGDYPYPQAMRHGVYSVSKSLIGTLSLLHFAQRYGDALFDEPINRHVPELAALPEWQGVTFAHALNMATGTRGGEALDQLFEPLMQAPDRSTAVANIARLGDAAPAPGERFHYATTHYFLLSQALQHYVEQREGAGTRYWELLREGVLGRIGAEGLDVLHTRDPQPGQRIPTLGYGARPTMDEAIKIARLIASQGEHQGRQLLSRSRTRKALGLGRAQGLPTGDPRIRYRHGLWSQTFQVGGCEVPVSWMQGHGGNLVLILPSGAIVLRFMDEGADDIEALVLAMESLRSSCSASSDSSAAPVREAPAPTPGPRLRLLLTATAGQACAPASMHRRPG